MTRTLVASEYLFDVPDVNLTNSVTVSPSSYASWAAMFSDNEGVLEYLLTPGDYTAWGPIDTYNRQGGTSERYLVIRYYADDAGTHPVQRASNRQAYVDGFKFTGPDSSYIIIQGVWVNDGAVNSGTSLETTHVVIDYCVIENCETYGLRMNATQNSYVQRCVVRNLRQSGPGGDLVGIQFKNSDTLPDFDTVNNFALDNEVYNTGDCIGFTESVTTFQQVQATIDGNDFYVDEYNDDNPESSIHENAGDFKAGSSEIQTVITNNRAWGFRRCDRAGVVSALGEAWVFQKYSRNILFEGNITGDCPRGMKDENYATDQHDFTAEADTDVITCVGHNLTTGAGPLRVTTTGTLPGGLAVFTPYWVIKITDDTFYFASSYANALANVRIDLTTDGTPTNRWKLYEGATRNITISDNQWHDIRDYHEEDVGAVWKPITDIAFEGNWISRCDYLCDASPTVYYDPTFTGNTLADVDEIQRPEIQTPALPYDPDLNTVIATPPRYDTYERKRWTGIELATGALARSGHMPPNAVLVADPGQGHSPIDSGSSASAGAGEEEPPPEEPDPPADPPEEPDPPPDPLLTFAAVSYFYPTGTPAGDYWDTMEALAEAGKQIYAVMNPSSGPGWRATHITGSTHTAYDERLDTTVPSGLKVLGYISTNYFDSEGTHSGDRYAGSVGGTWRFTASTSDVITFKNEGTVTAGGAPGADLTLAIEAGVFAVAVKSWASNDEDGVTLPAPLVLSSYDDDSTGTYWLRPTSTTPIATYHLYDSQEHAIAGGATGRINITSVGGGSGNGPFWMGIRRSPGWISGITAEMAAYMVRYDSKPAGWFLDECEVDESEFDDAFDQIIAWRDANYPGKEIWVNGTPHSLARANAYDGFSLENTWAAIEAGTDPVPSYLSDESLIRTKAWLIANSAEAGDIGDIALFADDNNFGHLSVVNGSYSRLPTVASDGFDNQDVLDAIDTINEA